jgi:mannonate dehydratase
MKRGRPSGRLAAKIQKEIQMEPSESQAPLETNTGISRRDFGKLAVAGALASSVAVSTRVDAKIPQFSPGIKISVQSPPNPTEDDLLALKQLGVEWVNVGAPKELANAEGFIQIRQRYEKAGIKVWNIGNVLVHNMEEVTLNLPGRDAKIEEYKTYLRNLAKAGINYTTYAHMGNGIWSSTDRVETRGASARHLDMNSPNKVGVWNGKTFKEPLSHGREFSKEEIWDNYTYFIRQVAPVAEELGIRIGIHPDDPPAPVIAGVPRCIFGSFNGYKRAFEIADSPNVGMCLCCGCWLEGGPLMGKDVVETIRSFGKQGKIWKVHFRNVDKPLPHFVETFMDNGYMDMYKIMKALREVNFNGVVILDHTPAMAGGRYPQVAYGVAYMRALLQRANAEVKG